jgi:asparagine synthase (glutamine-hydrolysing)
MCGICGIFNLDKKPVDRGLLVRMNNTMAHRGPDGEGYYTNAGRPGGEETGNVGLGHRRLSIIDLQTGDQPIGNEDGTVQVVLNGEIYNFIELREVLEGKGHVFKTRSDTESVVHGYEEWGEQVFERLRGMFALAVWDSRQKRLVIARDRIGKKPLYYLSDRSRLAFASELKALLELPGVSRDIDPRALDCYMSFGYVPSPFSIFKSIRKLPPGSYAVADENGFRITRYWNLHMEKADEAITEADACRELERLIDEAVRVRLVSDVPLGAFLSGGVDSSLVVASMARINQSDPVKTASIGFSVAPFNELEYARVVAKLYKTDHMEFVVEARALEILDKIVWHLDEPFADSSAIPTYYVSQMARQRVTVALSGDGGDETFAGYINRYSMVRLEDRLRRRIPGAIREGILKPLSEVYPRLDSWPRPFRLRNFLSSLGRSFER